MLTFVVYVESSSSEALAAGVLCTGVSRVEVAADSETEASLVACQMVACRDVQPTSATIDWTEF